MTILSAVVAGDLWLIRLFELFLRTELGYMAQFAAVTAQRAAAVDNLARFIQASEKLLAALRERIRLARTIRLLREAVGNAEPFPHVSLKVHVGENADKGALRGNEEKLDAVVNHRLLKFSVSDCAVECLHVLLDRLFGVIHVPFNDSTLEFGPGVLGSQVCDVIAIDLASVLALALHMACESLVSKTGKTKESVAFKDAPSWPQLSQTMGGLSGQSLTMCPGCLQYLHVCS